MQGQPAHCITLLVTDDQAVVGGLVVPVPLVCVARTQQLAPIRARLLSKGTLVSDGHELHFPVPGMAAFVLAMREAPADGGPPGDRVLDS